MMTYICFLIKTFFMVPREIERMALEYANRHANPIINKHGIDIIQELYEAFVSGYNYLQLEKFDSARVHYLSERSSSVSNVLYDLQKEERDVRMKISKIYSESEKCNKENLEEIIKKTVIPSLKYTWWEALEFNNEPVDKDVVAPRYRELVAKYHPDNKKTGDKFNFGLINSAWTIFKNL